MNNKVSPFEYHNGKLGVKMKFLINDRNRHDQSMNLISYKALNQRVSSKTKPERQLRRASIGIDALVEFNSLEPQWRDALVLQFGKPKEQVKQSYFASHYIADRAAFDFFCAYRYGDDNSKKLAPEVIELYTYNASVLNTVLKVKHNRKMYAKSIGLTGKFDIWQSLSNDVNAFRDVAHDLPATKDGLRYKVNRYVKESYDAVISGKYGKNNAAKVVKDEQLAMIEELLNKHQNLNNQQIADIYNSAAKIAGWKQIGAGTVAKKRKELDLYVFAGQHGVTELMHQKQMQIKRSRPSHAMLFWSMDGWDAELLYQKTIINKDGNKVTTYHNRLTVVFIVDPFNYYIVGYAIGTSESPSLIKSALKNAFEHTEKLFGNKYKPYQLQTDRYQIKHLEPIYLSSAKYYTPAKVKNSKAKPIEQFFDKFNEKHFQAKLLPNWSGHNVTASNQNQVNDDYLNKIKHQFPDEYGCRMQIITAIENDRAQKVQEYIESFAAFPMEEKMPMAINQYLRVYGETTGYTNKFKGDGLTPTILGIERAYDTFDLTFRKYMHEDWMVFYDENDLSKILVTNAKSQNGKLVEEIGTKEFILEEKELQPMALYDQHKSDAQRRQKVYNFNDNLNREIMARNNNRYEVLSELFTKNPELDTLKKLMITDSSGQHKDHKSAERLKTATKKISDKQDKTDKKIQDNQWKTDQENYLKEKVNLNKYVNL